MQVYTKTSPDMPSKLTPREEEILLALSRGLSNKAIGKALCIEESTVEGHVHRIFRKLGVTTRTEAARYAWEHGIYPPKL